MHFPKPFTFRKSSSTRVAETSDSIRTRVCRFESLETRDLLSLSPSSADYQALVAASSFESAERQSAIWVTSLDDVTNASDGKITLREALDYAGQDLRAGVVSSTIRFTVGGSITLSTTNQSLKLSGKSVVIDASDVGNVTIKAQNSLVFYAYGGTELIPTNLSLHNITVTGGTTSSSRGAGIQLASYCNLATYDCVIENNTSSTASGAGVYAASGTLRFIDTVFSNNGNTASKTSKGGAVFLNAGSLTALNTTFLSNRSGDGGAIYVKDGAATFTNCLFDSNQSTSGNGGAIASDAPITLSNVGLRNNSSAGYGGAIYLYGDGESVLTEVAFLKNSAISGGALYQDSQAVSIKDTSFSGNIASASGGAVYVSDAASVQISNSAFSNNSANDGGAIFNTGSLATSQSEFFFNNAVNNGGALNSTSGFFEIRGVYFDSNSAQNKGGAIYMQGGLLSWLLSSQITNSSAYEGAGIVNAGSLNVADSQISSNVSSTSGGGFVNQGTAFITRSNLSGNQAQGSNGAGGGILNYVDATLTIVDTTLCNNKSTYGEGGAIANNGSASLFSSTIVGNSAGTFGGGVRNLSTFNAQYTTFLANQARNGGAVSDSFGSVSTFHYSTLWGNEAAELGGALYSYGAPNFQNCALRQNVASSADVAAYYSSDSASSKPTFSSTAIESNYAQADVSHLVANDKIVIIDADLQSPLANNHLCLDDFAVNSGSVSKTLKITNYGGSNIRLSNFSDNSVIPSGILSYKLTTEHGDEIDVGNSFTLGSDESIYLTFTINPKSLGAHVVDWTWQTDELTSSGAAVAGSARALSLTSAINVARAASARTSIETLDDSSDYNISVNQNGSFTISLSTAPSGTKIVFLKSSTDAAVLSTDVLMFDQNNYQTAQTVNVSIDSDKLLENGKLDKIIVSPQFLGSDANFNGVAFTEIELNVADYVALQPGSAVDVNELVPAGTTRWDFDGDGDIDAITYGTPYWVDPTQIVGNTLSYLRTRNGVTTTTTIDVANVNAPPQAQAEIAQFKESPGLVRIALEALTNSITRWRVNWGDGSPCTVCDGLSSHAYVAHAYSEDGRYPISIELIDGDGKGEGLWTLIALQEVSGVNTISAAIVDAFSENADDLDELTQEDYHFVACAIVAEQEKLRKERMNTL